MPLAIYARNSSDEQRRNETIRTQTEFLQRFCALHSLEIADRYVDEGVSGTVPLERREQGARLLADATTRRFDTVLVYKLDRLGRDPRVILNAVHELEGLGLRVLSATEPFDTATPSGRFLLTILSGVAGLERDTIIERTSEGTRRTARAGVWMGGVVPYGYRVTGSRKDARLAVHEPEAEVVRTIYRLTVDERWSCAEIAQRLNLLGVPTHNATLGRPTAGIWRSGTVWAIMTNTAYKGVHQYGKRSTRREIIERECPAIVDAETWERAQAVLRDQFLDNFRGAKHRYLLRGLIRCGTCGRSYIGNRYCHDGRWYAYYVCNGRHNRKRLGLAEVCPGRTIDADELEAFVWSEIAAFLRNPGSFLERLSEGQPHASRGPAARAEAVEIERAIATKLPERDMILDLYRRGRIGAADLDRQLDRIGAEERALRDRLSALRAELGRLTEAERQATTAEQSLARLRENLAAEPTWEQKRELVELLVSGITVTDDEVVVRYRLP